MANYDFLEENENLIDKWTILYKPHGGGSYNGVLYVTNKRLIYDAKFDMSIKGLINETLFYKTGSQAYVAILKSEIANIELKTSFFKKQVILTLNNQEKHIFDYGMLSVTKVAEAIKS